jgi:hypothetical protein
MVTSANPFEQLSQAFVELATPLLGSTSVIKNNIFSSSSVSYLLAPLRNRISCGEQLSDRGYELFYMAAGYLASITQDLFNRSDIVAFGHIERFYGAPGKVIIKLENGYAQNLGSDILVNASEYDFLSECSGRYFASKLNAGDDFWYLLDVIRFNSPLAQSQVTSDAICVRLVTSTLVSDLIHELSLDSHDPNVKEFSERVISAFLEYPGRDVLLSRASRFLHCSRNNDHLCGIIELVPSILKANSPLLRDLGLIIQLICGEIQYLPKLETSSFGLMGIDLSELAKERWRYLRGKDAVAPPEFINETTEEWSRQSNQNKDDYSVVTNDSLYEHFFLLASTMIQERQEVAASLLAKYPRDEIARVVFAKSLLTSPNGSDGEKILQTMIDEDKAETPEPYMTLFYHMLSYGRLHEALSVIQTAIKKWSNDQEVIQAACELNSVGCTRRLEYENYIGC